MIRQKKQKHIYFAAIMALLFFLPLNFLFSQFVLPDDRKTTHKDIDVVRSEDALKLISNLSARLLNAVTGEIELTWENPEKTGKLALVRSDKPIETISILLSSGIIAVLDPGTNRFSDFMLKPGNYYYALVNYEGFKNETAVLSRGQNYTIQPVIVTEYKGSDSQKAQDAVQGISTEWINPTTLRVKWNYKPTSGVSLSVYRDGHPLDKEDKVRKAIRLGVVDSSRNYFDDINPAAGDHYYAVMVQDSKGVEKIILKSDQTYTSKTAGRPVVAPSVVKGIKAVKLEGHSALISWSDPDSYGVAQYEIYRSKTAIIDQEGLKTAEKIASVTSDIRQYVDTDSTENSAYYAVLSLSQTGELNQVIQPGQNSLEKPVLWDQTGDKVAKDDQIVPDDKEEKLPDDVVIPDDKIADDQKDDRLSFLPDDKELENEQISKPKHDLLVQDLRAVVRRNGVYITWSSGEQRLKSYPESAQLHLFRFSGRPDSMSQLTRKNHVITLPVTASAFLDVPEKSGFYYYAVFVSTPKGVSPSSFVFDENVVGPVIFESPGKREIAEGQQGEDDQFEQFLEQGGADSEQQGLDAVLRATFQEKKYIEALEHLDRYRNSSNEEVKARAIFYMALSNYYLGNYEKAVEYLLDPSVKKRYNKRANFWYRQALERIDQ